MILHCMRKEKWIEVKDKEYFGEDSMKSGGFIHCSPVEYMWRVAPNFNDVQEELVLLCIEPAKLRSEVRWEDDGNYGRAYPHVYGLINLDAVTSVLPYLKNEHGAWIKNNELESIEDK